MPKEVTSGANQHMLCGPISAFQLPLGAHQWTALNTCCVPHRASGVDCLGDWGAVNIWAINVWCVVAFGRKKVAALFRESVTCNGMNCVQDRPHVTFCGWEGSNSACLSLLLTHPLISRIATHVSKICSVTAMTVFMTTLECFLQHSTGHTSQASERHRQHTLNTPQYAQNINTQAPHLKQHQSVCTAQTATPWFDPRVTQTPSPTCYSAKRYHCTQPSSTAGRAQTRAD
jgi:hypothetical protein